MKNLLNISAIALSSALVFGAVSANAGQNELGQIKVSVTGFEKTGGKLMVALFLDKDSYKSDTRLRGQGLDVETDTVSSLFSNLPSGEYAIKLYYDVNKNGQLDTNLLGIPSEPFGFSNNAPAQFGPAKWEAAKFTVTGQETRQNIQLVRMGR